MSGCNITFQDGLRVSFDVYISTDWLSDCDCKIERWNKYRKVE
uniref:Uncharacterized protein n=1 Tax=Arundo donax TaxID=35708 RepID=A0A0A9BE26_ARUDO